ncbi:MAG: hypothetical protein QNJ46_08075 [Leptolyngbyaceae cyanobacterium MO_188.B28]|nr:hypothetical protein [Leptolyngbyaceae cyanobacterium MO_188.B28]
MDTTVVVVALIIAIAAIGLFFLLLFPTKGSSVGAFYGWQKKLNVRQNGSQGKTPRDSGR